LKCSIFLVLFLFLVPRTIKHPKVTSMVHSRPISRKCYVIKAVAGFFVLFQALLGWNLYAKNENSQSVALIENSSQSEFAEAARSFCNYFNNRNIKVDRFKYDGNQEKAFWTRVEESQPKTIVTFGTQATRSAMKHVENIPILYSMTFQESQDFLQDSSDAQNPIGGLSLSIPIQIEIDIILNAMPLARRIGILYSDRYEKQYFDAVNDYNKSSIAITGVKVESYTDVPHALSTILTGIDCLIVPPDANIYHTEALSFILRECFAKGIPVMAFSKQLAISGAPLSVGINYYDIGIQTAELALQVTRRIGTDFIKQEYPRSFRVYINDGIASKLGIYFSRQILDKAEIVSSGDSTE